MSSESEYKNIRANYFFKTTESAAFDNEKSEGDKTVLDSLKVSAMEKARIVLKRDPKDGPARRVVKWTAKPNKNLNTSALLSTFTAAGFETYKVVVNSDKQ